MGSLISGKTKTTSKSDPWAPQGDALKGIFNDAKSNYDASAGTPFYQGPLYAGMDDKTKAALGQVGDFVKGDGATNAKSVTDAGRGMLSQWSSNPNAIDELMKRATEDPTAMNIQNATAYANNPAIDGQIDAASRDIARNLNENEITGINRAASGSGNINSTRAGVAEGVARRGAADRVGDISASIRGEAYDRGLALSENARQNNLGNIGNAGQLSNQQFGLGIDGISAGNNLNLSNLDSLIKAGKITQEDAQGQIDADFAKWQGNDTRKSDLLNRYYSIVGANNWGGTQTNTQKGSPSILGAGLGIASTAAAFSDRRLKRNIVKVAELEDGLGVYDYDYVWGKRDRGVMADEVAQLRPWALGPVRGGFQTVIYGAL